MRVLHCGHMSPETRYKHLFTDRSEQPQNHYANLRFHGDLLVCTFEDKNIPPESIVMGAEPAAMSSLVQVFSPGREAWTWFYLEKNDRMDLLGELRARAKS